MKVDSFQISTRIKIHWIVTTVVVRCFHLKPRPAKCRSNTVEATMSEQHCRMLQVEQFFRQSRMERFFGFGSNVERFFGEISSFSQSRNEMIMFSLFRLCRKNRSTLSIRQCCFDIVASTLLLVWTGLKSHSHSTRYSPPRRSSYVPSLGIIRTSYAAGAITGPPQSSSMSIVSSPSGGLK